MNIYTLTWLEEDEDPVKWSQIPSLEIDCYPWYEKGEKQKTTAQAAVSERNLYLRFLCEDRHIFAQFTEFNEMVSEDSCVEFFFAPDPDDPTAYFNLEINCCGNILFGWGHNRYDLVRAPVDFIETIEVKHSVPGPKKEESPEDRRWKIEAVVSLESLRNIKPFPKPKPGMLWRGNFYRCGGKTDVQFACWSPIDLPTPEYHCPQFFGELRIGK